jgi:hypothetical protein
MYELHVLLAAHIVADLAEYKRKKGVLEFNLVTAH